MRPLLCLPLLAPCACAADYQALVDDWIASTGQTFTDCGALDMDQCAGQDEAEEPPAVIACLLDAFAACEPARADITRPTVEGDPILSTFLVVPTDEGCGLTLFIDTRQDAYGPQRVDRYACEALAPSPSCPWYEYSGCGDPVESW